MCICPEEREFPFAFNPLPMYMETP
jgi:hypothetical protein